MENPTTIMLSKEAKELLESHKICKSETYNDVILRKFKREK